MAISSRGEMGVGGGSRGGSVGGGVARRRANSAAAANATGAKSRVKKMNEIMDSQRKLSAKEIVKTHKKYQEKIKSVFPAQIINNRSVRSIPANLNAGNRNMVETWRTMDAKSGQAAKQGAASVNTGKPGTTVKINSGNTTRTPSKPAKAKSYWQLKNLPSLVKINSGKGNTTVSPTTYRGKATKKAAPARRATGRKSN